MIFDDHDEKILSALILSGPLTTNKLNEAANIPKATFQKHRDNLVEEGLMIYRDIPYKNPTMQARRPYYAREYSIANEGIKVILHRKARRIEALLDFFEQAISRLDSNDLRSLIGDDMFNEWVLEAIEDYAARQAEEEYHNRP